MSKIETLANLICTYSLDLKKGERLYLHYRDLKSLELVQAIIKRASQMGVFVYPELYDIQLESMKRRLIDEEEIATMKELEEKKIDFFDAFIYIAYSINDYEDSMADKKKQTLIRKALAPSVNKRANEKKWVLLSYPSPLDAYKSKMRIEEFYDYALEAMTIDYKNLREKLRPLKELMEKTDQVQIVGPGTNLTFSIKGMPAVICTGEKNLPDGEIYTAPVLNSVNGTITYNTPSPYDGNVYHHVALTFKDGKIIKAKSDEAENLLETVFAADEGAHFVGEFSFGVNPMITKPKTDILYDEKIVGSLHFTPGAAYDDCDNGNRSSVHWDLVLIQTKEYGGGQVYFDHVLIRENGNFCLPSLTALNM